MQTGSPYSDPIKQGRIRILLEVHSIECEVENNAPDFIDVTGDHPHLIIRPEADLSELTDAFEQHYPLVLNEDMSNNNKVVWELDGDGIWFDIDMEQVKDVWLTDYYFRVESSKPRYLAYYIQDLEHRLLWLQVQENSGEIRSLSEFKKTFVPAPPTEKETFSGADVLKCCELLAKGIQKIDLRTGSALIKLNTENGRLYSLLKNMADKLGYNLNTIDKETINRKEMAGENVSHIISLK